ncbi:MAG: tripartite tricarboxylate transporter permease [Oscillospiraceae bacterium]|nr:tripartite tricarboxylate transporter permease [Oscillospiraceae bacterium]
MFYELTQFLDPMILFLILVGTLWGVLSGAIPGISVSMSIILVLPFTFGMDAMRSISVLMGVYVGGMCGGHISAILMRTPGTPSAAATVFDGYPMAQQGKAGRAIGIAILSSVFGGIISGIFLAIFAPILGRWALNFQSAEFFALALLGLSCTASIGSKSWSKALLSACLGLLLSTVGMDPFSGVQRFMFGNFALADGISFIPVMIGVFAFAEIYRNIVAKADTPEGIYRKLAKGEERKKVEQVKVDIVGPRHILKNPVVYIKSTLIGIGIGIIPAAGASIASMVAYGEAKRSSKTPELFGHGAEEGIVASETSDSAAVGATLIPTLTLGIPGGPVAALILVSLTMHGVVPGPQLVTQRPDVLFGILWAIILASLSLFVWGFIITKQFSKLMQVPYPILGTVILTLGLVGAFTLRSNIQDLVVVLIFSFVGVAFERFNFSVPAFILGLVLGPIAEVGFRRQLIVTGGDFTTFFTRPVSLVVLILAVVSFAWPFIREARANKKKLDNNK